MNEPLSHFSRFTRFDPVLIKRYVIGEKFTGIMLKDGRIGICAVLEAHVDNSILTGKEEPDLENHGHRVILNSYFNAIHNYNQKLPAGSDIFNRVNLISYRNIVIVGYFESLVMRLRNEGIPFRVFDRNENINGEGLSPVSELPFYLKQADAVIITGSSIANNTFYGLVSKTSSNCSVFLLGPSNILHPDIFKYKNVKVVFGSVFERYDERILDSIGEGHGARNFLTEKNKVCLNHPSFKIL
ncbi:MAG: Rossmann-like domain-containing protein [Bacteroidales bacterium]